MSGFDVFVFVCWCALATIPAGLGIAILVIFAIAARRAWGRGTEQVWADRMQKLEQNR